MCSGIFKGCSLARAKERGELFGFADEPIQPGSSVNDFISLVTSTANFAVRSPQFLWRHAATHCTALANSAQSPYAGETEKRGAAIAKNNSR